MSAYDVGNTNVTNYGPYLLLTSKLRTVPGEQKGCEKGVGKTGDPQYIDTHLTESKTRLENVAMVYIDYKKPIIYFCRSGLQTV